MIPGQQVNTKTYLETIRKNLGEERFVEEIRKLAGQAAQLGNEKHDTYWKGLIAEYGVDVNYDELKTGVKANPDPMFDSQRALMAGIQQQVPGIKTQAHLNAFMAGFDVFRQLMNAIFTGETSKVAELRKALDLSVTAATQVAEIAQKLADVPEAAIGKEADEFKKPPAEFAEYDVQMGLLTELNQLTDSVSFNAWYVRTKDKRDAVKSQSLRNALIDAIRAKKLALDRIQA